MADVFSTMFKTLGARLGVLEARSPQVLYGRVETVNPLSVRLSDGALLLDVESLEPDLDPGDPVRLLAHGGFRVGSRAVVVGRVHSPIQGRRILANADLNDYTTPGNYNCPLNVDVATFTNGPPSNAAGALVVLRSGSSAVIQFWHGFDDDGTGAKIYRRRLYSGSWSAWKLMNPPSWVGSVSGGQRSGVTFYNVTLNFPTGLFSTAPRVFAQINNQAGGGAQLQVMTGNVTASSCLVGFFMTTGTMNGHWCEADVFAIEPS